MLTQIRAISNKMLWNINSHTNRTTTRNRSKIRRKFNMKAIHSKKHSHYQHSPLIIDNRMSLWIQINMNRFINMITERSINFWNLKIIRSEKIKNNKNVAKKIRMTIKSYTRTNSNNRSLTKVDNLRSPIRGHQYNGSKSQCLRPTAGQIKGTRRGNLTLCPSN